MIDGVVEQKDGVVGVEQSPSNSFAKIRLSEHKAKRKTKFFVFALSNVSIFGIVKDTIK